MAAPKSVQAILGRLMTAPSLDLARQLEQELAGLGYQHSFRLEDVPEGVHERVFTDPDDGKRAAEICLNFDKVLRLQERGKTARNRSQ